MALSQSGPLFKALLCTLFVCLQPNESDSDSEYQAVSLPISAVMPLVVPVTGESFCQCPTQTEVTSDPSSGVPDLGDCLCGEEDQSKCVYEHAHVFSFKIRVNYNSTLQCYGSSV